MTSKIRFLIAAALCIGLCAHGQPVQAASQPRLDHASDLQIFAVEDEQYVYFVRRKDPSLGGIYRARLDGGELLRLVGPEGRFANGADSLLFEHLVLHGGYVYFLVSMDNRDGNGERYYSFHRVPVGGGRVEFLFTSEQFLRPSNAGDFILLLTMYSGGLYTPGERAAPELQPLTLRDDTTTSVLGHSVRGDQLYYSTHTSRVGREPGFIFRRYYTLNLRTGRQQEIPLEHEAGSSIIYLSWTDSARYYVLNSNRSDECERLMWQPIGEKPQLVYQERSAHTSLLQAAVSGDFLYWQDRHTVYRAPLGQPTQREVFCRNSSSLFAATEHCLVFEDSVVFTDGREPIPLERASQYRLAQLGEALEEASADWNAQRAIVQ